VWRLQHKVGIRATDIDPDPCHTFLLLPRKAA
jgi:hypothetical protein